MADLVFAIALMTVLSVGLFVVGRRVTASLPKHIGGLLIVFVLLAAATYVYFLWDNVLLAKVLPFSSLIILGNWFPLITGLLAGIAWEQIPGSRMRKGIYASALAALGVFAMLRPLVGQPPECRDLWEDEICMQSSQHSCSAACAATVLAEHGISTSEQEMAVLCLTRKGTLWQGLYRGLKLKTANTPWTIEVVAGDLDRLRQMGAGPMILAVGIPKNADVDPIYSQEYGWTPGEFHSVIFYGFAENDRVDMAEPTPGVGREQWTVEDLRVLWQGRGMRLIRRD